ncbi:MAG: ArsR family transcriptional regulator [Methanocellales archaeon]
MDSEELLDLLGNINRRKILRLLSIRPCYVSELVERLEIGPKAVLEHLNKLEQAGLIEAYIDEQRRKYFQISDDLHLEIMLSPYLFEFNTITLHFSEEEFPLRYRDIFESALRNFKGVLECFHAEERKTLKELREEFYQLRALYRDLSLAQRCTQARLTEVTERCVKAIGEIATDYLEAEILMLLFREENATIEKIARQINVPREDVIEQLEKMRKKGMVLNKIENGKEVWSINLEE